MMTNKEFDNGIKEKLSLYTEEVPDMWGAIESTLDRKRSWRVVRRISYATAAAAACLAAGLFLFNGEEIASVTAPSNTVAQNPVQTPSEILPIEKQLEAFNASDAMAVVTPNSSASKPERFSKNVTETVADSMTPEEPTNTASPASTVATPTNFISDTPKSDNYLTSEDLPENFWDEDEEESTRHTSQISILSNLSASSDKAISRIYNGGTPMHSASQTGKSNAASGVTPLSGTEKFDLPLSVGIQFKTGIANHLYAGAGLNMTYLVSKYDALINSAREEGIYNQLWYVGIPVNLYWNFVDTPQLGVYATAGGAIEKCVYQRYVYGSTTLHESVDGFQYSVASGIGIEYWFAPKFGLYLDPSLVYYFDNSQPLSIRTQQPLQARMEVGLRFKL